ncbi:hypothetical protein PDR5_22990 [Pseudomonas sp. DR 5-09]|nr:hypothetical protein PDR5_22990 [Pseudomonas sp. DR 5-09]
MQVCASLAKQTGKHNAGINGFDHWNHEAEFFLLTRPRQNGPTFKRTRMNTPMNLNFAFACMVVVSFAIALGHA